LPGGVEVLAEYRHERHNRLLVRIDQPLLNPALTMEPVDLEDLVLAYLERPGRSSERAPTPRVVQEASGR
jgi:hypothetical protein